MVEPRTVNYLMLSPGETARVIPIRDPAATDSAFWIEIAESGSLIGFGENQAPWEPRVSFAILQYSNEKFEHPADPNFRYFRSF